MQALRNLKNRAVGKKCFSWETFHSLHLWSLENNEKQWSWVNIKTWRCKRLRWAQWVNKRISPTKIENIYIKSCQQQQRTVEKHHINLHIEDCRRFKCKIFFLIDGFDSTWWHLLCGSAANTAVVKGIANRRHFESWPKLPSGLEEKSLVNAEIQQDTAQPSILSLQSSVPWRNIE